MVRLLGGLTITVWTLYAAPHRRRGQGRGVEGTGLYPELGGVLDPGEDGPLGPLWPTPAHDIAEGAVFVHPQTSLTTHA